jgi:hypothetical protein
MQLKLRPGVRFVAASVVSLASLGSAHSVAGADEPLPPKSAPRPTDPSTTRASFEMASYKDTDHVTVLTPSIAGSVENVTAGASLRGRYLVDVVSAASVDVVSTASRKWTEVRQAGSLSGEYKPRDFGIGVAGSISSEPDYFSYGLSVQVTKDFDEKNTSLAFGYGYGHDTAGRSGTPFAIFSRDLVRGTFNGGITQVIDRSTLVSVALNVAIENGDQSKPYRYVPVFAPSVAASAPLGASIAWVTENRLPERPLEQLPLSRRRFSLTGRLSRRFDGSTLRVEERAYDDTWGLKASTTDARWFFDLGRRFTVWPHARFHLQSEVDFWRRAYTSGAAPGWDLPEFRTGDRELGPLWTGTGGLGIKWYIGPGSEPQRWALGFQGDASYTSFLDDLYLTSRTAFLGALTLEGSW